MQGKKTKSAQLAAALDVALEVSAEGAHQEFMKVLQMAEDLRQQWVTQQLAGLDDDDDD